MVRLLEDPWNPEDQLAGEYPSFQGLPCMAVDLRLLSTWELP